MIVEELDRDFLYPINEFKILFKSIKMDGHTKFKVGLHTQLFLLSLMKRKSLVSIEKNAESAFIDS